MEITSSSDHSIIDATILYSDLSNEIDEGLKKIEEDPAFIQDLTRLKTVDVALTVLKNGKEVTINKTLYPHKWSWLYGIILAPYYYEHYEEATIYSREKTQDLIKEALSEAFASDDAINSELLSCAIQVEIGNLSFFSWDYWLNFKNSTVELCSHNFTVEQKIEESA